MASVMKRWDGSCDVVVMLNLEFIATFNASKRRTTP